MQDNQNNTPIPHGGGAAKAVLTFLICVIALLLISIFTFFAVMRPDNAETFVDLTNISRVLEETGVYRDISSVLEQFPEHIPDSPVSPAQIEEFIRRDNVSGEISEIVGGFLYAFSRGDLDHHITSDDLVAMARQLAPDIESQFGYAMTEQHFTIIQDTLDDINMDMLSVARVYEETDLNPNVVSAVFSIYPLLITGTLSVIALLFIFIINIRRISRAVSAVGFTFIFAGIIFFPLGLILLMSPQVLGDVFYIAARLFGGPATFLALFGVAYLVVGIVMAIAGVAMRRKEMKQFARAA